MHLYYAAVQNLVYVPQTTVESSDTPAIQCAQHVQQSVEMSIQLPAGLQCDPVQMTEVVQQEYVFVGGAWLYPRAAFIKLWSADHLWFSRSALVLQKMQTKN